MIRKLSLAAIAALMLCAGSIAQAADVPPRVMPRQTLESVSYNWTGLYIGAHGGYGWGSSNYDLSFAGFGSILSGSNVASGALGGLQAGYNWQFSQRWVGGLEAMYTWSGMRGSDSSFFTASYSMPWSAAGYVQLGYLIDPQMMLFVGAGPKVAKFKTAIEGVEAWEQTKMGVSIKGGAKYMVARNWFVGLSYTYDHFSNLNHDFETIPGLSLANKARNSSLLLDINYKF